MNWKARLDREDELNRLGCLSAGQTAERIALISGEGGIGKSELLREFMARHTQRCAVSVVDFKNGSLDLANLISQICDAVGWTQFGSLTDAVSRVVNPVNVTVSRNVLIGQNQISVALSAPDEQTRLTRSADLTNAFISDLRGIDGRVVLIFDVFEKCDDPFLQKWFASIFLPAIHRSTNLAAILAGRAVPEPTLAWEAMQLPLVGIPPEHWHTHAQRLGISITLESLTHCCNIVHGNSLSIAQYVESLTSRGYSA